MFNRVLVLWVALASMALAQPAKIPSKAPAKTPAKAQQPTVTRQPQATHALPAGTPKKPADAAPRSTAEIDADAIFDGKYFADVHRRYHADEATRWAWWATWAPVAGVILGVMGFCIPLMFPTTHHGLKSASDCFGLVTLLIGLAFAFVPFERWRSENATISSQWAALSEKWGVLEREQSEKPNQNYSEKIAALGSEQVKIESNSPVDFDKKRLLIAQHEQNEFQGLDTTTE